MLKTLQSALFISFVGLVIFSMIVLAVIAAPGIRRTTVEQISGSLYQQMALVQADFAALLAGGAGPGRLQARAREIAGLSESRVTVISADGRVVADSASSLAGLERLEGHGRRPEIVQAGENGKGVQVRYSQTLGRDLIYAALPLRNKQGALVGFLRFSVPATHVTQYVMEMHRSSAAAFVITVLVAMTLSILIARAFARPIVRLAGISRRIAEGRIPFTVSQRSRFEVGKLERAVEEMSHRLADSFKELSAEHSRLEKLEKYRSDFVANVSHELKTPLTAIRNYVETLLSGAIDDRAHNREFLEKIDKHAYNLSALIDDLLEISRLESKKDLGPLEEMDLARVTERALETVSAKAAKKNIALVRSGSESRCSIQGVEEHVYRAILNLLDNAVNYTDPGGRVELSCARRDGKLALSVSDTGIGIPAGDIDRVFERFYRVDKARSRELGGTGLGLAIVKHVMNIHNGSVDVQSEPGKGSVFTLSFPA